MDRVFSKAKTRYVIPVSLISLLAPLIWADLIHDIDIDADKATLDMALVNVASYFVALMVLLGIWRNALSIPELFGPVPDTRDVRKLFLLGIPMVGIGLFCYYLVFYPLLYVSADFVEEWVTSSPEFLVPAEREDAFSINMATVFVVVLLGPIVEELIFRGFLLGRLSIKFGRIASVVASSILFAVLHPEILGSFIFALFLCIIRFKYDSLIGPILVHAGNNLFAVILATFDMFILGNQNSYSLQDFRADLWLAPVGAVIGIPWLYRYWQNDLSTLSWRDAAPHIQAGPDSGLPDNGETMSPQTYIYKTIQGIDIHADVYRADRASGGPVMVVIHGGALISGSREWVSQQKIEMIREAGYTVVSIDYRLAPETKLPAIIEDVSDALDWVRSEGNRLFDIDPDRMGVIGYSAGGYLTLMAGTFKPTPKALVSFYGYGDVIGDWYRKPDPFYCSMDPVAKEDAYRNVQGAPPTGAGERGAFYLYCRQQGLWPLEVGGQDPNDNPAFFHQYCPERIVTKDYPPTLLVHGTADTDVPYERSEVMANALQDAGVFHEFITIQDGGHGFDNNTEKPEVQSALARVMAFIREHV